LFCNLILVFFSFLRLYIVFQNSSPFVCVDRYLAAVADVAESEEAEADRELAEHLARHDAQFSAAPKHGTVLYNWGAYPFYGLLGTTIISKEVTTIPPSFLCRFIIGLPSSPLSLS